LTTVTSIRSTWPPGSAGISSAFTPAHFGLRAYSQLRPGTDSVIA
jgi:hypothetical protein